MSLAEPTMHLRLRLFPVKAPQGENSVLLGYTTILEQKWVDPARTHAPEWRSIPCVDQHGNPLKEPINLGGEDVSDKQNKRTGEGISS